MTPFKRWLGSVLLMFSVALLSTSCQMLFGDFKVGDGTQSTGQGGNDGSGAGGNGPTVGPLLVVPTPDVFTSDHGAQARFYVSLTKKPNSPVTLPIVSSSDKDGKVAPASLVFTEDDWAAAQTVIVSGQPDPAHGDQRYTVLVGPAVSEQPEFNGAQATVSITNIDNDSPGVFVTPKTGLVTTEAGGMDSFTVQLNSKPGADVVIGLTSSDTDIGVVTPSSLTFNQTNWAAAQRVTVTGKDDKIVGDDRPYQITVEAPKSDDPAYAALPAQMVAVVNRDNDVTGVTIVLAGGVDPTDGTRLRTSEDGESATFTVVLNTAPKANVEIPLTGNPKEGTLSPATLTFTPANYAGVQTVTVTGADDSDADGNQPYQLRLGPIKSDDPAYGKLTSADLPYVNVVNADNDKADIAVTLLTNVDPSDSTQLLTSEQPTSATFSVRLRSKPSAPVRIDVTSSDPGEGTVSPDELDFTQDNWSVAQTVTVTGVGDGEKDGNVSYNVTLSAPATADPAYQMLVGSNVKVVNTDADVAAITTPKLLTGIDGGTKLVTTEHNMGSASFSVALTSKPKADVTLPVSSSNPLEGKVSPTMLTFTPANYSKAQEVTVTGVNDDLADGNQAYTVTVGESKSDDPNYVGLSASVKVTNQDDDSAYIYCPVTTGTTYENGSATAKFDISLHSQPNKDVTVTFVSTKMSEGTVSPSSMVFTSSNWKTPQQLTVTGVDDKIDDGDIAYTVQVNATSQDTTGYMNSAISLSLVNKNDDTAGIKLNPTTALSLAELGGKATFTVVLTSQPTSNVVIALTSSDTKQGTVAGPNASSPSQLTFTASGSGLWSSPQTVTVSGVDNSVAGANPMYTISLKTTSATTDAKYAALAASTVSVTNTNEDVPGFVVTGGTCATAPGTSVMYGAVLKSQPLGPVTLALTTDPLVIAGTVSPAALTFTTTDWNSSHPFTVTGVDDGSMGKMTMYTVSTTATSSLDATYNNFNVADLACVNTTPAAPPPTP